MPSLVDTTENCRYCLMCRHAAPVGYVMHDETVTPHGVALVVASQRRGLLEWNASSIQTLYAEPDSGNCRAHCVTDQPLPAAIAAVRAEICAQGLAPDVVYDVHDRLRSTQSAYGAHPIAPSSASGDVALFVGDEAHHLWPSVVPSALALVRAAGVEAVPVGVGRSSGYMACSLGFPATATEHARACIEEVRATGARTMLVLSAGDLFTFRQLYPERLNVTWPEDVRLVDLVSFLAERHGAGDLVLEEGVGNATYVDPTHAVRAPERFAPARSLCAKVLGKAPGELFWRRERAHPVGSTALQFTRQDIAERLTRARLQDAVERGARELICEDPGTLFQLQKYAEGVKISGLFESLFALLPTNA